jgi:hypothetical protein
MLRRADWWTFVVCCLVALMMEAASTSESMVNFYQTARRNITEENHAPLYSCETTRGKLAG